MKKFFSILTAATLIILSLGVFVACTPKEMTDYVSQLTLDMNSETAKLETTVTAYVDGDTTHFAVPTSIVKTGVLKARYLAINTPESTGKIEDYGKKASNFTKEKLKNAVSIYIESDTSVWETDSTGGRYLTWVWYKPDENSEYRNLNLEILQNGLAIASSTANNRYGDICVKALDQAKANKLLVHSGKPDPDMYHGAVQEITLKELRSNLADYEGIAVAVEGIVTREFGNSVYIQEYDEETDMYYGIGCYYGFYKGPMLDIFSMGNRIRMVGTLQFYENGGFYQISGLEYYEYPEDDDAEMVRFISAGHEVTYPETSIEQFTSGKVEIITDTGKQTYDYAEMALNTTISMNNLQVINVRTTENDESSADGALTITCKVGDKTIDIRTQRRFTDTNGNVVTASYFEGKTIDVKGLVEYFKYYGDEKGQYQIKVVAFKDITIK